MEIKQWLDKVAYIKESDFSNGEGDPDFIMDCYFSKFDDSYMAHVGLEEAVEHLAHLEITDELTHGTGFSPKENKWYGWSHRAIYGFEIGSTCKKGDCHYNGSNPKEREQAAIDFWTEEGHINVISKGIIKNEGDDNEYYDIQWEYSSDERLVPNKSLHGTISSVSHYVGRLGKGEWTAKTMEDAKQMAIDFNEGVS